MNYKLKTLFLSIALIIVVLFLVEKLMFVSSEFGCGKFVYSSETKGATYFHYIITIDGEKKQGSISKSELKVKYLPELMELDCIKVEYSLINGYFMRVVDQRVLK